ncbi:hypothetical protein [Nostoc sp. 'Peltigera membranacea cyanobiont' 213]|uniref:hypothetical protein n=2 Tax=unclassified Nostoc TaxID=2593658 RepID=UPI001CB8FB0D|nr:hypothetical protein [Nostoc sp. 'Peltigera membranacea cyanobiont' 213]
MNMVLRNTGETPTFEAGCTTRISQRQASTVRKTLVNNVYAATACLCSNKQLTQSGGAEVYNPIH